MRLPGVWLHEREVGSRLVVKRGPGRCERVLVRRLGEWSRRQHREIVVMMLWMIILVVVPVVPE